jgi:hypothetical protein
MKLLLHACCGPCLTGTLKAIDRSEHEISAYWYNPNIHPYQEYKSRFNNLKEFVKELNMPLIADEDYGLRKFVKMVSDDLDNRCDKCYADRIRKTAIKAKELGFDGFSSTLLVSPYQKHEYIKSLAYEIAKEVGVGFYYIDPRPYFREGNKEAKDLGQYMQKYCGCVFSEEERYLKKYQKKS